MTLAVFENFLTFAERSIGAKADLPPTIDAAEFENALVSFGVVLLHSHMEQCLRAAIEARCIRCTDVEIRAFALSVRDEKSGRIGIGAIKDTLARFSSVYKNDFRVDLETYGGDTSWESIKNQRKTVAHDGMPATCSLADLRLFYEDVRKVLGFLCSRLGLSTTEVAGISHLIVIPTPVATTTGTP